MMLTLPRRIKFSKKKIKTKPSPETHPPCYSCPSVAEHLPRMRKAVVSIPEPQEDLLKAINSAELRVITLVLSRIYVKLPLLLRTSLFQNMYI